MKWTKIKNEIDYPDFGKEVFLYTINGHYRVGNLTRVDTAISMSPPSYKHEIKWHIGTMYFSIDHVTHWMLPTKPQKRNK